MKKISMLLAIILLLGMLAACSGMSVKEGGTSGYLQEELTTAPYHSSEADEWMFSDDYIAGQPPESQEEYDDSKETGFVNVLSHPLSTFSSDVDTASYSNMRRYITQGDMPTGIRIEELVNYFDYEYTRPTQSSEDPFSITAEVAPCPWNEDNLLAMIGVQGMELPKDSDIANNIVFLIDVSGSMYDDNKLPLLQKSFGLLVDELDDDDRISVVTYASGVQVVADSLRGGNHNKIKRVINGLEAGGSTAGEGGLRLAYKMAEKNFIEGGNNRIILATDGDFNVGENTTEGMTDLIEQEREKGVFISVLGFGMYNLKDNMMETIADAGNGNYAYIDTLEEAKKVLVDEFDSTMFVIAKDLKFQVEFNGSVVSEYRLVGYNNRRLKDEDFNNDKKDAGDVGAGHSVTAFYELVPVGGRSGAGVDELKYQTSTVQLSDSTDFMTVKVRYKQPTGEESKLVEKEVGETMYTDVPSQDFQFASSVAEFGLILTDSQYQANSSLQSVQDRASQNLGSDPYGLRNEFVGLVEQYSRLSTW